MIWLQRWVGCAVVGFALVGAAPLALAEDCNDNGIDDPCDIDCGPVGGPCIIPGCGQSEDNNRNGVPDECEPNIMLELRPAGRTVLVGQTVDVRLYAASDTEDVQRISVFTAILTWDPSHLRLEGHTPHGPYVWGNWLSSSFPVGTMDPDELNDTWLDGDAFYKGTALAPELPPATPDGLLVTTMHFTALAETSSTDLGFIPEYGNESFTRILSGDIPGMDVTGAMESCLVTVLPCGNLGDMNFDCQVDLVDLVGFEYCLEGPDVPHPPGCEGADLDDDGDVDLSDWATFQAAFTD